MEVNESVAIMKNDDLFPMFQIEVSSQIRNKEKARSL